MILGKGSIGESIVLGPNGTSWRIEFRKLLGKAGVRASMVLGPHGTS